LCNTLDCSPARLDRILSDAKDAGIRVEMEGDHVGATALPSSEVQDTGISATVGKRQIVAAVSDLHFGSKYAMRAQFAEFMRYAYSQGVRDTLVVGDILDGCYRHGRFELTHTGLEDQARDAAESMPHWKDHHYHAITGNHDETFWAESGVNVARAIVSEFADKGRRDLTFYGDRSAYIRLGKTIIHMWHPKKGQAYARSYRLQKRVESYVGLKPHILLTGHLHQAANIPIRGVRSVLVPCFQGSMSRYGQSLEGGPVMGGLILSWTMTEHGAIRSFIHEDRLYFEDEQPFDPFNHASLDGEVIQPAVSEAAARPVRRGVR